jgi:LuxR family maltose regulon positive regulatory protein
MPRPVIATKLYVPAPRQDLVSRPRLRELLGRAKVSRLTLVSAPAGFGKTTLLADWLAERRADENQRVAWVSLEATDSEPAVFWTYVATALEAAVPGTGSPALKLLASATLPTQQMLISVLNELAAAGVEVWLVLDDYHLVDNHELNKALGFLLDHVPPHVHVVLSTRADPPLPLSRWRTRGQLVEVRAADLRFTTDESTAYLNGVAGLDLAADDLEALEQRTEGWIAALQLAALSIRGHTDVEGFIARFAGNDRYIVDYLVEEVLAHQPEKVREFLLHTAVLERLTGPLCDAITGRDDGRDMLLTLERSNLFIIPLDDQRLSYRYHHLFSDVLRARLLAERPEQVPVLHRRASMWYQRHDLTEQAVRHALAAHDFDRAAHLMELAIPTIRRNRDDAVMIGWLQALPDDTVRRSPVLSVMYGWMLMVAGDLEAVEARLDDAEQALSAVAHGSIPPWADSEELPTLPATIAVYRASLAQARGDVESTSRHARDALELAGPHDHLARGAGAGFLGLAAWAEGDVPAALETFAHAVASLHSAGNTVDELSSTVVLADMWLAAGRPSKARRLYQSALQLAEAGGEPWPQGSADLYVGLSEIDREHGDIAVARRHLETAAGLDERASTTENRHRWFVAMGLVVRAEGDLDGALRFLDRAEQLYLRGFYPDVRPIPALKARIWIAQGRLTEAAEWADDQGLAIADDVGYLQEFNLLTVARLVLARHRSHGSLQEGRESIDQVVFALDRLGEAAESSGRAGSALEVRMLQALAHDAMGEHALAHEALGRALAGAPEPEAYTRLFLDEGPAMAELLGEVTEEGVGGDQARRLRAAIGSSTGEAIGVRPPANLPVGGLLTDRELGVLTLLDGELSGPQIAHELFISLNTMRTHTKSIFAKLDATNRRTAVRRAHDLGLL